MAPFSLLPAAAALLALAALALAARRPCGRVRCGAGVHVCRTMGSSSAVSEVAGVRLLVKRPPALRGDVLPVVPLYLGVVYLWAGLAFIPTLEWLALSLGFVAALHALLFLSQRWSAGLRRLLQYATASSLAAAEFVFVQPTENCGAAQILPLAQDKGEAGGSAAAATSFVFRQRKYEFDPSDASRARLVPFPDNLPLATYLASKGVGSDEELAAKQQCFGPNTFVIPIPEFKELFLEQLEAPMFVFQVFCMLLFCLDDYWYFSIFTLVMLFVLEGTVVRQRLQNLQELEDMRQVPFTTHVYRNRRWNRIPTDQLVPGDVCSIVRSKENETVPADLLIMSGACIVNEALLTGEAVPLMKEPVRGKADTSVTNQDMAGAKLHMLFAGTKVVQTTPPPKHTGDLRCQDGGVVCFVLRTGFATEQGTLVRTILSFTERATANTRESFLFICFLLLFAVSAAGYVWQDGVAKGRKYSKLIVECLLIICTVVPPELPVQLSLAVNQALNAMRRLKMACTEPFRIPFAGKVDVCCFDKTGTLTSDQVSFRGVVGLEGSEKLIPASKLSEAHPLIATSLATCHALVNLDGGLIGDPLECAILEAMGWSFTRAEVALSPRGSKKTAKTAKVLQRFHFSSDLKRMSAVVSLEEGGKDTQFLAVCKGAPEVLEGMFTAIPDGYTKMHKRLASQGARVLALGYQDISAVASNVASAAKLKREEAEANLTFGGFIVLKSSLKQDSTKAVKMLRRSAHHIVMITGDNPLTACHVASEVSMTNKPFLIATSRDGGWHWCGVDDTPAQGLAISREALRPLIAKHCLCVTGEFLAAHSGDERGLRTLLPFVSVYARVTPDQKALAVGVLNKLGLTTLMCGDGTNDVGALKRAHVGIALMAESEEPAGAQETRAPEKKRGSKGAAAGSATSMKRRIDKGKKPLSRAELQEQKLKRLQQELADSMAEGEVQLPKLGDASIAAPFTSKRSSVMSVCSVIRQGRCTLVTTMQMCQILALNCLINAYSFSVLHLAGVKLSDTQMTMHGLATAMCMFFLTRNKPMEKLSKQRPRSSLVNVYMLVTVLLQSGVHLASLLAVMQEAYLLEPPVRFDPDRAEHKAFSITLLNSAVFCITGVMQVSTFFVNCRGQPFMEGVFDNKPLMYTLLALLGVTVMAAAGGAESYAAAMELAPMPFEFRKKLLLAMVADFVGAFVADRIAWFVFSPPSASQILRFR